MSGNSLFFKPKNKKLSKAISIESPRAFKSSIRKVKSMVARDKVDPVTAQKSLQLAQNRAGAMLGRKNLSSKERRQFSQIKKMKVPDLTPGNRGNSRFMELPRNLLGSKTRTSFDKDMKDFLMS